MVRPRTVLGLAESLRLVTPGYGMPNSALVCAQKCHFPAGTRVVYIGIPCMSSSLGHPILSYVLRSWPHNVLDFVSGTSFFQSHMVRCGSVMSAASNIAASQKICT